MKLARPARFERATFGFGGRHSIQLSYGRFSGARGVHDRAPRIAVFPRSVQPARPAAGTFLYAKVIRRKPVSAAVLSIAALLPRRGKLVAKPRIAYGAMAPTAIRAKAVEAAIDGKALDAATITAATKVAAKGCTPQTDAYASDWYRSEILPVHLARLLGAEAKTAR